MHTQARDVGQIDSWSAEEEAQGKGVGKYVLESLRGFVLFPQTAHVESVAVLRLVSSHRTRLRVYKLYSFHVDFEPENNSRIWCNG